MGGIDIKKVYSPHSPERCETSMSCARPNVRIFEPKKDKDYFAPMKWYIEHGKKSGGPADNRATQARRERELKKMIKDGKAVLIPCKRCQGCIMDRGKSWANRMEMELPYHENAWFLTLTYDNDHVPKSYDQELGVNKETGEIEIENLTLNFKDLEGFWKRLRRWTEYHERAIMIEYKGKMKNDLMYYAGGEYGGKTHRPHYHAIVYGLNIQKDELIEYKKERGKQYYYCEWLNKIWGNGYIVIGAAEWESMAYTARYCTKKAYGSDAKKYYESLAVVPEDSRQSKTPAIGWRYYEEHKDEIYDKDSIQLKNGKRCKPPTYFDKLFDLEHSNAKPLSDKECEAIEDLIIKAESEELKAIKRKRRKIANDALFAQLKQTGLTMQEYYELKDRKNQDKFKQLIREEI